MTTCYVERLARETYSVFDGDWEYNFFLKLSRRSREYPKIVVWCEENKSNDAEPKSHEE